MNHSPVAFSFGGELASLIQAFDWTATPVGPSDQWPESLKTILGVALASNHPMLIWWGKDLIQFYNDAYRKTMDPEQHPGALGQRAYDCWRETWHIIGPQIESIMAGGRSTWHEDQLVPLTPHRRREDIWWTYGFSPIGDSSGVRGVLVICNDVTGEHLAKDELKRVNERLSEEIVRRRHEADRLKVLFRQAPGLMCVLRGPQHVFEFANDAYRKFIGSREIYGKSVRDVFPEAEGQGYFELLDQVFTTGRPFFAKELPLLLQLNPESPLTRLFVDFAYQPIIEPDGTVSGIFVEGFDVTEQRNTREALRISEERLKEGMMAARMAVWDWDLAKGELVFSANAQEVFGADPERLKRPWELLHPDDVSIMKNAYEQASADRGEFQATVRMVHPQTGRIFWSDIWGKILRDETGRPVAIRGVALDVTERKSAKEKLKEADRRKDEFLAMLAHELRNPLAPISAAAQILSNFKNDEARVRQTSEIITRQVRHMTHMIDDLLDAARVTRGQIALDKQQVDLGVLLTEAVEQVRPIIERCRHRLALPQTIQSFPVLGDPKRLVQVIANLLNNAAKYTPEGGHILVRLEAQTDHMVLIVQDNGIGIDQELLERIFELFSQARRTADRSEGGLGIGLSLVKGLVELHGGSVTAESKGSGAGSTFTVMLPRHIELSASMAPDKELSLLPPPIKQLKIMAVDDNKDAALLLSLLLETSGYETLIEHDPYRALERVRNEMPDVCLLDIGLPGMDGSELARQIRSIKAAQPLLIAITGYGQDNSRETAREAGFDHYLVKPVDAKEIVALLAEHSEALARRSV